MRRNWLLLGIALLVAVLAIGAVACGDDDDDDNGNGDEPEATEVIGEPEATEEVTDGDGDGGEVLLLVATVLGVDDAAGISGQVTISPDVDGILVDVVVAGLPEGARANHLHHGDACPPDPNGEVHIALTDVEADANGDGIQSTSDATEPIEHFAAGHYYAVHDADGAVIGCGTVVSGV